MGFMGGVSLSVSLVTAVAVIINRGTTVCGWRIDHVLFHTALEAGAGSEGVNYERPQALLAGWGDFNHGLYTVWCTGAGAVPYVEYT